MMDSTDMTKHSPHTSRNEKNNHKAEKTQKTKSKRCFICNSKLLGQNPDLKTRNRTTKEHFIPQWLLREANLLAPTPQNRYLLSNDTVIYGAMTVPCCERCNGSLSRLEVEVRRIFQTPVPMIGEDRITMFLWLLKVAYGMSYIEANRNMSNRNDVNLGNVISRTNFQRMKLFHRPILHEYCQNGSIAHLNVSDYSLLRVGITNPDLHLSRSTARNRVTVAWRGQVFRLTIDCGVEESQALNDTSFLEGGTFNSFMSSNDLFTPKKLQYPRLEKGRQRMMNIKPRRVRKMDCILVVKAVSSDKNIFLFLGHLLEKNGIVAEENSVQIVVKRKQENERMHIDEIELQQPGLLLITKTAAITAKISDDFEEEEVEPTLEEELRYLLFIIHQSLGVTFRINPGVKITPEFIP